MSSSISLEGGSPSSITLSRIDPAKDLPSDVFGIIMPYLTQKEHVSATCVSRGWKAVSLTNAYNDAKKIFATFPFLIRKCRKSHPEIAVQLQELLETGPALLDPSSLPGLAASLDSLKDSLITKLQILPQVVLKELQSTIHDELLLSLLHKASFYRGVSDWEAAAPLGEDRSEAARRIKECFFHQKTELALLSLNLTSLPPEIGQLKQLRVLAAYDNNLRSLPPEIGLLANLTSLDLERNELSLVPPEIGQLKLLESLDLASNRLNILPTEMGHLIQLEDLYLDDNELNSLPASLVQLSKASISLGNNLFPEAYIERTQTALDEMQRRGETPPTITF